MNQSSGTDEPDRPSEEELAGVLGDPSHPDADRLLAFDRGSLEPAERTCVKEHLDTCRVCRARLRELGQLVPRRRRHGALGPKLTIDARLIEFVETIARRPGSTWELTGVLQSKFLQWKRGVESEREFLVSAGSLFDICEARDCLPARLPVPEATQIALQEWIDQTFPDWRPQPVGAVCRAGVPFDISVARLPTTGEHFFGREEERAALDRAWADEETRIVVIEAEGGLGKSALVNRWLQRLAADNYCGAAHVFGWSFFDQGAGNPKTSAEEFFATALPWFGTDEPEFSPATAELSQLVRLVRLIRRHRTLLILDGIEPLLYPPGPRVGFLHESAGPLRDLLRELAARLNGLCVITTRLPVADLAEFVRDGTCRRLPLHRLPARAGVELLGALGVTDSGIDREQLVQNLAGHPLALTLMGTYLQKAHGGKLPPLGEGELARADEATGGSAQRVMSAYAGWFAEKPELSMLHILGLFDRPAAPELIDTLLRPPAIAGLTDALVPLRGPERQIVLSNLIESGLVARPATNGHVLDTHPLVRSYFGNEFRKGNAESQRAWQEAHARLYRHHTTTTPERPTTHEDMARLFAAVGHGCAAGLHRQVLHELYIPRIQQGPVAFSIGGLGTGAFGSDLAALANFFETPWRQTVAGLDPDDTSYVLTQTGLALRALGYLREAGEPFDAAFEHDSHRGAHVRAAIAAGHRSERHAALGELGPALIAAEESVDFADRSGNLFQQAANRTRRGHVLHLLGRLDDAHADFIAAEAILQSTEFPKFIPPERVLWSVWGYRWCALLLDCGQLEVVETRAQHTLGWTESNPDGLPLDEALDRLTLGKLYLLTDHPRRSSAPPRARNYIEEAIRLLRTIGPREFLPEGLLARAALQRNLGDRDGAEADIGEALAIATRSEMVLHVADSHLEAARVRLAFGDRAGAANALASARELIRTTGYGRARDVLDLETQLRQ